MSSQRPENELSVPTPLSTIPHRSVARDGVRVYSADVPPAVWRRETFTHATLLMLGEKGSALARWTGVDGKRLMEVRPGDVWAIPPGVETTCEFHHESDVLLVLLEVRRLEAVIGKQMNRPAGQCSVVALDSYATLQPVIPDLHFVVHRQSRGLPYMKSGNDGRIDQIDAAHVLARTIWMLHYIGMRTVNGKVSPQQAAEELEES